MNQMSLTTFLLLPFSQLFSGVSEGGDVISGVCRGPGGDPRESDNNTHSGVKGHLRVSLVTSCMSRLGFDVFHLKLVEFEVAEQRRRAKVCLSRRHW